MKKLLKYRFTDDFWSDFGRTSFVALMIKLMGAISGFFLSVVITRILGLEQSGIYFYMFSVVSALSVFMRFGVDTVIVRRVASAVDSNKGITINKLYWSVSFIIFILSLLASLLLFVFIDDARLDIDVSVWIGMIVSLPTLTLIALNGNFFQGIQRINFMVISQGLGISLSLLFFIGFVKFFLPILGFSLDITVAYIGYMYGGACVVVFIVLCFYWQRQDSLYVRIKGNMKNLFVEAVPYWGGMVLNLVLQWAPAILLGWWAMNSDVAIYSVAFRTALLVSMILSVVNGVLTPKYAIFIQSGDITSLRRLVIISGRVMCFICFPLAVLLCVFSEWVMSLFGVEFSNGASVLVVLVLGQFFNVITGSVWVLLSMSGKGNVLLMSSLGGAFVMLLLFASLVPLYGAIGAAVSQSLGLMVQVTLNTYLVKKYFGFYPINLFQRV